MKTLVKTTLFLACSFVLISGSCKKEKTGTDALPAATTEGKNTLGCLVNGNAFVAQAKPLTQPPVTCRYGYIDYNVSTDHEFYVIGSDNKSNSDKITSIKIFTNKIDIQEGTTYPLQNLKDNGAYAEYEIIAIGVIATSTSLTGELTITKFDEINKIASGTFWFNTENDKGEKVEVKDGRFDAKIL